MSTDLGGQLRSAFQTNGADPYELFPGLSADIDRRIKSSESNVKNWILAGLLGNLVVVGTAAGSVIFYMGQMSVNVAQTRADVQDIHSDLGVVQTQVQNLDKQQALVSQYISNQQGETRGRR